MTHTISQHEQLTGWQMLQNVLVDEDAEGLAVEVEEVHLEVPEVLAGYSTGSIS
jgi:hypothetical protein